MKRQNVPTQSVARSRKSHQPDHRFAGTGGGFQSFRESLESVVIAIILALLFRTFNAEAFVIPTGSMSPALLGRHKDVNCPKCDARFRTTDSEAYSDRTANLHAQLAAEIRDLRQQGIVGDSANSKRLKEKIRSIDAMGGTCPMCRYVMPFRPDLPQQFQDNFEESEKNLQPTYPGDRILVNKYEYSFREPKRWEVVVFKYPGNGSMNYIKRLTGLPNERLQIYQGDLFTAPREGDAPLSIAQKPAAKVAAMLQPVHDTHYEPVELYEAGWPLRWGPSPVNGGESQQSWIATAEADGLTVKQSYEIASADSSDAPAWLRYRHLLPQEEDWEVVKDYQRNQAYGPYANRSAWQATIKPQLITDFNPYNAQVRRDFLEGLGKWSSLQQFSGLHWVGDLAVECQVKVVKPQGKLILEVVEAGKQFRCSIDLTSGKARFGIVDAATGEPSEFEATAQTSVNSAGSYSLRFANVDDQLLLWVDNDLIEVEGAAYDAKTLWSGRENALPWSDEEASGDLTPAGVGALNADLQISRLKVLRDIYYIAVDRPERGLPQRDYRLPSLYFHQAVSNDSPEIFMNHERWDIFATRQKVRFVTDKDQFFVMGDNSPFSEDARLWVHTHDRNRLPGGAYLGRKQLIGKAVCVFWPHSWGSIPGLPILPGWPAFGDMRLVR